MLHAPNRSSLTLCISLINNYKSCTHEIGRVISLPKARFYTANLGVFFVPMYEMIPVKYWQNFTAYLSDYVIDL